MPEVSVVTFCREGQSFSWFWSNLVNNISSLRFHCCIFCSSPCHRQAPVGNNWAQSSLSVEEFLWFWNITYRPATADCFAEVCICLLVTVSSENHIPGSTWVSFEFPSCYVPKESTATCLLFNLPAGPPISSTYLESSSLLSTCTSLKKTVRNISELPGSTLPGNIITCEPSHVRPTVPCANPSSLL